MITKITFQKITLIILFIGLNFTNLSATKTRPLPHIENPDYITGDWFAQIDMPQDGITSLLEMNMLDNENCIIRLKFSGPFPSEEEYGKAKYKLEGSRLIITFLNEEEVIQLENIFDLENVYDINLTKDRLVILDNIQFRNVDVNFGRGYDKRGYAEIIFPENE